MTRESPSFLNHFRSRHDQPCPEAEDEESALTEVYRGENPEVDIVAVHGLNGTAPGSFTAKDSGRMWLGDMDMLPRDIKNCRVLTYSYPASITALLGSTSSDRILQHAQTLVAELVADRQLEDAPERPIIFALVYSASRTSHMIEHIHSIYVSTYGILFLGTPHHGSDKANLAVFSQRIVNTVFPSKLVDTDSQLLQALQTGSEVLQEITDNFIPLMKNFRIYFFWEQEKTDLGVTWDYIVTESSAAPILDNTERAGLKKNHQNMCKFSSRKAPGYKLVAACLMRYVAAAQESVPRKWDAEKAILASMRQNEAQQLLAPSAYTLGYSSRPIGPIHAIESISYEDQPRSFIRQPVEEQIPDSQS